MKYPDLVFRLLTLQGATSPPMKCRLLSEVPWPVLEDEDRGDKESTRPHFHDVKPRLFHPYFSHFFAREIQFPRKPIPANFVAPPTLLLEEDTPRQWLHLLGRTVLPAFFRSPPPVSLHRISGGLSKNHKPSFFGAIDPHFPPSPICRRSPLLKVARFH